MNTKTLQTLTEKLWGDYCEVFPKLVRFDPPKIILNNRLTVTVGYNWSQKNTVDLAAKFFVNNKQNMLNVILPHELAHQIDFNLNGWRENKKHHGREWQIIMVELNQIPDPYHTMKL